MAYVLKKIITDDPFSDYVIYYSKYMAIYSITKNESEALAAETKESYVNYQQYYYAVKNELKWELWDSFTYEQLSEAFNGKYTSGLLEIFAKDKSKIPIDDREVIMKYLYAKLIATYDEKNDYYRVIMGLRPSTSNVDILLQDYGYESEDETTTYLHDCSLETLITINNNGILDRIISAYPNEKWIPYIKARVDLEDGIDPIQIRQAENFELLYVPSVDDAQMKEEFVERYTLNREYVLNNIYSEAFKYGSDYYDNFIQVLIIILTVVDMLDTIQDHIVRKDILEVRCIQYIFEQHGIPYYDEIPLKYQVAMMKNINELLKFKSTARCMIDLCSLFGFPSSEIFQLYLLRTRKQDENGNYIFNYKTVQKPINVGTVQRIVSTFNITSDEYITLEYPVGNYFDNGNILEVWLDDIFLSDEFYTIYENRLYFENRDILKNHQLVRVIYYYDENTIEMEEIEDYRIIKTTETLQFSNTQSSYELNTPISNYFNKGGFIKVILGMLLVPESAYDLNIETNTITFKDKFLETADESKYMEIIYFYSNTVEIHHTTASVVATQKKQTSFKIPEPYPGYYASGSRFFVSVGGTYIASNRYHVVEDTLIFNSSDDYIDEGQSLFFHFVYSDLGQVDLITKTVEVKATELHQIEFDIPVPYEAYFSDGNVVFIKVKGFYMSEDYYTITKNRLLINPNYAVYVGGSVEFTFIYAESRDIKHTTQVVTATDDFQQDFYIKWPYANFLERGNKLKVVYEGIEYRQDIDYALKDNHIEIFTIEKSLNKGEKIHFEFFYNEDNENIIVMRESSAKIISDNQTRFSIPVPYYKYFETGNEMIVTLGSTYVAPSEYTIVDNMLVFNNEHLLTLSKDRQLNFTFIYHSIYNKYSSAVYKDTYTYDIVENFNRNSDSIKLYIPFPFDNYLDLGNTFEIRVGDNHSVLDPANYEIINNEYLYIRNANQSVYPHGDSIQFVFIYTCIGYEYETTEKMEDDCELKFVKVPILESPDAYMKDTKNYLDYDTVTLGDKTWDGDYLHNQVKQAMLYKDFNYTRTKYFSISNMISMCNIAYQLPYFMNMILDKMKYEENLTLSVPLLSTSHTFKFNDIITFMMCLSHKYIGVDDEVPTIAKTLYIKGFNFEADLAEISSYIRRKLQNQSVYTISNKYQDFKFMREQVPGYRELINIYTTNTEIYDHVVHEMLNADNKLIFDIYRKIYESLMTIKESKDYFKVDGRQVSTITEWLQNRDITLYEAVMRVNSVTDEVERRKLITDYLDACNYELEAYLDADTFRFFLGSFAGNDTDALIRYLRLVINFFKSYKIQLHDINTQYIFDDKLENTIKAIDYVLYNVGLTTLDEGYDLFDLITYLVTFDSKDSAIKNTIREKLITVINDYVFTTAKDKVDIRDYIKKYFIEWILKDEVIVKELINLFIQYTVDDRFDSTIIDIVKTLSFLKPKDYIKVREKFLALIKEIKSHTVIDFDSTLDVLKAFFSEIIPTEDFNQSIIDEIILKSIIVLTETNGSGVDMIRNIQSKLKLAELVRLKDKIELFKQIYTLLTKNDKYNMVDLISSLTNINITDHDDYVRKIYDLIARIQNQFTITETSAGIKYITQQTTSTIKPMDLTSILDKIDIAIDQIKSILGKDYHSIMDEVNTLIARYKEKEIVDTRERLKYYASYKASDYDTESIIESIAKFITSYTHTDKILVYEDINLIESVIRRLNSQDRFIIASSLSSISKLTSKDIYPYSDNTSYTALFMNKDMYTQADSISNFTLGYTHKDLASLLDRVFIILNEYKPVLAKSFYRVLTELTGIDVSFFNTDQFIHPTDSINKYTLGETKHDSYRFYEGLISSLVSFTRTDSFHISDYMTRSEFEQFFLSHLDRYIFGEDIIPYLMNSMHHKDIHIDPTDSINKYTLDEIKYDSYEVNELLNSIKTSFLYTDKFAFTDYLTYTFRLIQSLYYRDESLKLDEVLTNQINSTLYLDKVQRLTDKLNGLSLSLSFIEDIPRLNDFVSSTSISIRLESILRLLDTHSIETFISKTLKHIDQSLTIDEYFNKLSIETSDEDSYKLTDKHLATNVSASLTDSNINPLDTLSIPKVAFSLIDKLSLNDKYTLALFFIQYLNIKDTSLTLDDNLINQINTTSYSDQYMIRVLLNYLTINIQASSQHYSYDEIVSQSTNISHQDMYRLTDTYILNTLLTYITTKINESISIDDSLIDIYNILVSRSILYIRDNMPILSTSIDSPDYISVIHDILTNISSHSLYRDHYDFKTQLLNLYTSSSINSTHKDTYTIHEELNIETID